MSASYADALNAYLTDLEARASDHKNFYPPKNHDGLAEVRGTIATLKSALARAEALHRAN